LANPRPRRDAGSTACYPPSRMFRGISGRTCAPRGGLVCGMIRQGWAFVRVTRRFFLVCFLAGQERARLTGARMLMLRLFKMSWGAGLRVANPAGPTRLAGGASWGGQMGMIVVHARISSGVGSPRGTEPRPGITVFCGPHGYWGPGGPHSFGKGGGGTGWGEARVGWRGGGRTRVGNPIGRVLLAFPRARPKGPGRRRSMARGTIRVQSRWGARGGPAPIYLVLIFLCRRRGGPAALLSAPGAAAWPSRRRILCAPQGFGPRKVWALRFSSARVGARGGPGPLFPKNPGRGPGRAVSGFRF